MSEVITRQDDPRSEAIFTELRLASVQRTSAGIRLAFHGPHQTVLVELTGPEPDTLTAALQFLHNYPNAREVTT